MLAVPPVLSLTARTESSGWELEMNRGSGAQAGLPEEGWGSWGGSETLIKGRNVAPLVSCHTQGHRGPQGRTKTKPGTPEPAALSLGRAQSMEQLPGCAQSVATVIFRRPFAALSALLMNSLDSSRSLLNAIYLPFGLSQD